MNILFFIGNGFDINLGIETRYCDFYKYYQAVDSPNEIVKKLKENISSEYKNWSDLELSLGSYTENLKSLNEFDKLFEDILDNLGDYLEKEEQKFDFNKIEREEFFDHLCFPERSLSKGHHDIISSYRNQWKDIDWSINIITFNYTRIIEKILQDNIRNLAIGRHHNSKIITRNIEHIHGYTDDRMIMGVNDVSQIKNASFHTSEEVLEALVKTNCNKVYNHKIDTLCEQQIRSANLICIFGSSIGDTDNTWWELIGEQLKNGCQLIIFTKGQEINQRFGYKKGRVAREIKTLFLNKTKLSEDEKTIIGDRIYIGVNSNIFGNILKK